jgi:sugar/nucleoside kinase (ribokinase family)
MRAQGVAFDTSPLDKEPPTARSMIFVTPDGERSMNTYLGACVELGPEDVEEDKTKGARVTYFEGYLWDPPRAKEAILLAAGQAHAADREVAMTLSDPFCVDRYREEFLELMRLGYRRHRLRQRERDEVALPDCLLRGRARRASQGLQGSAS